MAEIIFGDYIPEEKANPYIETVNTLAAYNDENKSVTLVVDVNEATRDQLKFQRAANTIQKTARLRVRNEDDVRVTGVDEDGNEVKTGNVKLVFTLSKMHKGRRNKKGTVDNGDTLVSDAEIEELTSGANAKK
jgi:hypothetical protein